MSFHDQKEQDDRGENASQPEQRKEGKYDPVWRAYLETGSFPEDTPSPWYKSGKLRPWVRRLPAEPRCRICYYPFEGIGGAISRHLLDLRPSPGNPYFCNQCERMAEKYPGGAEVEATILFADVRGSTSLAENMPPADFSRLIKRFYAVSTRVLFDTNAMVEKLVGDAVTAYYTRGFAGPKHAKIAVIAARRILKATGYGGPGEPWVPVGIGLHTGIAYVGTVTSGTGVSNISILGDTANIGARLASLAGPGEVYLSQATAQQAGLETSRLQHERLTLKGRTQPVDAWVLSA